MTLYRDWTYQQVIDNTKALEQIEAEEVYLNKGEMPWECADRCESGGGSRMGMTTSVWFYAKVPNSKLVVRWSFEIEKNSANGKGFYDIKIDECKAIMKRLKGDCRLNFEAYLNDCAGKVEERAKEIETTLESQKKIMLSLKQIFYKKQGE